MDHKTLMQRLKALKEAVLLVVLQVPHGSGGFNVIFKNSANTAERGWCRAEFASSPMAIEVKPQPLVPLFLELLISRSVGIPWHEPLTTS